MPGNGPAPLSNDVKRKRGSRHVDTRPTPVVTLAAVSKPPAVPAQLGDAGREAWERLWTAAAGWLSPRTDIGILTRLCESLDERRALWSQISEDGYTVPGSQGQMRPHPLLSRLHAVDGLILAMESKCGFTPADRTRIGATEVQARGKLDELLERAAKRRSLSGTARPQVGEAGRSSCSVALRRRRPRCAAGPTAAGPAPRRVVAGT